MTVNPADPESQDTITDSCLLFPDSQLLPLSPDSLQAVAGVLRYGRINKVVSVS